MVNVYMAEKEANLGDYRQYLAQNQNPSAICNTCDGTGEGKRMFRDFMFGALQALASEFVRHSYQTPYTPHHSNKYCKGCGREM